MSKCVGDLALQQVAMSLSMAAKGADVKTLADITSGSMSLKMLGFQISKAQLKQLQIRQQELMQSKDLPGSFRSPRPSWR